MDAKAIPQGFAVDWDSGEVTHGGATTILRPQSLAVLKQLHGRANQTVSKDEIMTAVWPNVAVTDDSLVQCITEIRKAIGDEQHTIVKTLPKRGYMLKPPLLAEAPQQSKSSSPWWPIPAALAAAAMAIFTFWPKFPPQPVELPTIAVLPFINFSDGPRGEKFAKMMTEDVITNLSHAKDFGVIARTSVDTYKDKPADARDIAPDLRVKYVLKGIVQPLPDKVRVTAQLIESATKRLIWSD